MLGVRQFYGMPGPYITSSGLLLLISYRGLVTSNHIATNQGGRGTHALVPPQVTEAPPDFSVSIATCRHTSLLDMNMHKGI